MEIIMNNDWMAKNGTNLKWMDKIGIECVNNRWELKMEG
jgi:hypothetical protein